MASTPLILTLTVLTAIILVLLILWIFIRYTRERRKHHSQRRAQLDRDATFAAESGEGSLHLHCTYQASGAPRAGTQGAVDGMQLQTMSRPRSDSGDKAEVWLRRGASKDDLRADSGRAGDGRERGVLGTKTVKRWSSDGNAGAWDMTGGRLRDDGLEGKGKGW
ncbi:hypothetical protein EKO04_002574 [Ascochyta lentis]|uniref:Uncharacterized protein n=1 Tax=Ascochyta lentis TaxID=205686 RepID=A0A8H7MM58_9PLEO|nr:hypothetical protein EKO04_002574 [Ascochyta lentis]